MSNPDRPDHVDDLAEQTGKAVHNVRRSLAELQRKLAELNNTKRKASDEAGDDLAA